MAQRGRVLDARTQDRIAKMVGRKVPVREVARTAGVSRNTARKYGLRK
jgi:DNA-binding CsgD family transcriptional regulator